MSMARLQPKQENSDNLNSLVCPSKKKINKEKEMYGVNPSDRANCQIADLKIETHVSAADIYSHPNCMRTYLRKYELRFSEHSIHQLSKWKITFLLKANEAIAPLLDLGYGFTWPIKEI